MHAVRQFYHCFGCGAIGRRVHASSARLKTSAFLRRCGSWRRSAAFRCPSGSSPRRKRRPKRGCGRKLLELHETAAAWFEEQLRGPEGALAREYLAGRGLSDEGIKKFRIGYAPDSFNALRDRLSGMADEETLRASGLFSSKEQGDGSQGPLYDRFRKRVMFPICNESGRVIAFTARTLETGEKAGPKYINSPETPLYSKGQVLFNLDKAKTAIRAGGVCAAGGRPDGLHLACFCAGIQNVIATSGTAFTEQQVALLRRHTSNVVVNFDPDAAGANAAEKSIALLTEEGFAIKIVTLEGGLDPDRFIRERGVRGLHRGDARRAAAGRLPDRAGAADVSRRQRGAEGEGDELSAAAHPAHAGEAGAGPVCRGCGAEAGHRLGGAARGAAAGGAASGGTTWRCGPRR